nr:MAG TPA: hypothetical protein [Siphoviridae sp. ctgbm9]
MYLSIDRQTMRSLSFCDVITIFNYIIIYKLIYYY